MPLHPFHRVAWGLIPLAGLMQGMGPTPEESKARIELEGRRIEWPDGTVIQADAGRLLVPENRLKPDSRTIEVAFVRLKSTSATPGTPIIYLAGGPGSPATPMAKGSGWEKLLELADLILLDQRGTGRSKPNLTWKLAEPPVRLFGDAETAQRQVVEAASQAAAHFRAQGVDLSGYTTVQSADDINDLREALGLPKVSLLGFSYGTHLALSTIRRHGSHLENVVLVGTEGPAHTYKLPSAYDTQFRKLAAMAAADPAIRPRVPDMVSLFRRVCDRLEREPMRVKVSGDESGEAYDVPVGKFGLQLILRFDIGDGNDFPVFPRLLYSIDRGDSTLLQWFVRKRFRQFQKLSAMSLVMDAASGASPQRMARIAAEAPGSLLGNAMNFPFPAVNEPLGTPNLGEEFRAPLVSHVRTLFVSGTLDCNTPPYQAEEVRWGMTDATHLIVRNAGHEDMLPHPQVREAIVRFLRGEDVGDTQITLPAIRFVPIEGYDPRATHPSVPRR